MKTYFLQPESIRELFDTIAPRYDFLNHLLSLRRDIYWRQAAVQELKGIEGWILDIATGTGDVAIEIFRQNGLNRKIFGLDFSLPMIQGAYQKLIKKDLSRVIALTLGDALSLPFHNNTFSATMIAFGLRNILNKEQALSEMVRVTKGGGKVVVLEFTLPRRGLMKKLYLSYFNTILPWVGGFFSGNRGAYAYLPKSVLHFQSAKHYEEMMDRAGLEKVSDHGLTSSITSIITGIKPIAS